MHRLALLITLSLTPTLAAAASLDPRGPLPRPTACTVYTVAADGYRLDTLDKGDGTPHTFAEAIADAAALNRQHNNSDNGSSPVVAKIDCR